MNLAEIPGWKEAQERERFLRDSAFLGLDESIEGFPVKALTLRHCLILRMMVSPFLYGGEILPTPEQLAGFLWVVSPRYNPQGGFFRWLHLRKCRRFIVPRLPIFRGKKAMRNWSNKAIVAFENASKLIKACREYMDEHLMDSPGSNGRGGTDYYSDFAAVAVRVCGQLNMTPSEVMDTPLKQIWQFISAVESVECGRLGTRPVLFNRLRDRATSKWMREENERLKKAKKN